jgi:ketosteroid isomerase-like protein
MSVEDNKALVRRYMQAVIDGDIGTIEALQHPDVKWWVLGVGDLDRAQFTEGVRTALLTADTRHIEITGLTAEGDRVAVECRSEMVFPGHVYRNIYHNLLVIRDGVIIEGREYMETRALQAPAAT